jgi:hypothetical protein
MSDETEVLTLTAEYPGTPEEVRVEWSEDQLRTMGTVKPGTPQKLNTFGDPSKHPGTPTTYAGLSAEELEQALANAAGVNLKTVRKRSRASQNWAPLTAATISMTAMSGAIPKPN